MKIVIRPRAWLDIEEAMTYLRDQAGDEISIQFWQQIQNTFKFLTQQPGIGRPRSDLKPAGLRSWRVNEFENWLVFYSINEPSIEVFRVRHGMMDLPGVFERE